MQATARIAAALASFALATSCSTASHAVAPSWCSAPKPFVRQFKELPDVRIQNVTEQMIKSAYGMVRGRRLVSLDATTYAKLLGAGAETPTERHLYLMRAGMMAPAGLSTSQLAQHAQMTNFSAYEGASPGSLQIVSLMTSERPQQPTSIPVLVAAPAAITEVSATCIGGR